MISAPRATTTPVTIVGQTDPLSVSGLVMVAPTTSPLGTFFSNGADTRVVDAGLSATSYANVLPIATGYALTGATLRLVTRGGEGCRVTVEVIETPVLFGPTTVVATLFKLREPGDSEVTVPLSFPGLRISPVQTVRAAVSPAAGSTCHSWINVQGTVTQ